VPDYATHHQANLQDKGPFYWMLIGLTLDVQQVDWIFYVLNWTGGGFFMFGFFLDSSSLDLDINPLPGLATRRTLCFDMQLKTCMS